MSTRKNGAGQLFAAGAIALSIAMGLFLTTGCTPAQQQTSEVPAAEEAQSSQEAQTSQSSQSSQEAQTSSEDFEPFVRVDCDDLNAWQGELDDARFITKGHYDIADAASKRGVDPKKFGIDPSFVPSTEGLDTLNISGSAQFSVPQFSDLAKTLRECADGKDIYIIDCRRESHAFLDERSFSWYCPHNWSNEGLSTEKVEAAEKELFENMVGTTIQAYPKEDESRGEMLEWNAKSCMTERELVEAEGFKYIRIPILDFSWPSKEEVDTFVDLVKSIDTDNTWLHFHCHAGRGRTAELMVAYDMMKNPSVPLEDICVRHAILGGQYALNTRAPDEFTAPLYEEKAKMTRLFYDYVQQNKDTNYETSWSEWLAKQS